MRSVGATSCVLLVACCWLVRVETNPTPTPRLLSCPGTVLANNNIYPLNGTEELSHDCFNNLIDEMLAGNYQDHLILRVMMQYHKSTMKYYLEPHVKRNGTCYQEFAIDCGCETDLAKNQTGDTCRFEYQWYLRVTLVGIMNRIVQKYPQ